MAQGFTVRIHEYAWQVDGFAFVDLGFVESLALGPVSQQTAHGAGADVEGQRQIL